MPQNDQGMGLPQGSGAPQQAPATPNTPPPQMPLALGRSSAYVERLEAHSAMLGRIGALVTPWVTDPEMTTEDAVKMLLADYYDLEGQRLRGDVEEARVCNGGGSDD